MHGRRLFCCVYQWPAMDMSLPRGASSGVGPNPLRSEKPGRNDSVPHQPSLRRAEHGRVQLTWPLATLGFDTRDFADITIPADPATARYVTVLCEGAE